MKQRPLYATVVNPLDRCHINGPEEMCPKCGAPTISDTMNRWIMCMMFDNIASTAIVFKPNAPTPKFCDYAEWRPGGEKAAEDDREERRAMFGTDEDKAQALRWLAEGHSHRDIAWTFGTLYGVSVLPSMIESWEREATPAIEERVG